MRDLVAHPEFAGHFEGLRERRLQFPFCDACGRFHWYPMLRCPHCRAADWQWRRIAGRGEVYSWTVVRHAFTPAVRDRVPYIVALVTFEDAPGVRLVTNIVETAADGVSIGMAVQPVFDLTDPEKPRVLFRPVSGH
jgi:uncharacterized OB-fold protein